MEIDSKKFEEIKSKAEAFYKNLDEVYCPYFKDKVYFNSQGLEHLKFKRYEKPRLEPDQYMRFKLFHLVPEILKISHTLQGKLQIQKFERIRAHNRTDNVLKLVTYFEFIALVNRDRVKIVVKQLDNGQKFFWSIIPFWGMNEKTKTRVFHEGVPEED